MGMTREAVAVSISTLARDAGYRVSWWGEHHQQADGAAIHDLLCSQRASAVARSALLGNTPWSTEIAELMWHSIEHPSHPTRIAVGDQSLERRTVGDPLVSWMFVPSTRM
jgi:hypothetical protein